MALTCIQSGESVPGHRGFGACVLRVFLNVLADPLRLALGAVATAMALGAGTAAWATPITFSFSGAVTGGSLGVAPGTPVSGLYTFESSAPDFHSGDSTQGL